MQLISSFLILPLQYNKIVVSYQINKTKIKIKKRKRKKPSKRRVALGEAYTTTKPKDGNGFYFFLIDKKYISKAPNKRTTKYLGRIQNAPRGKEKKRKEPYKHSPLMNTPTNR